MLYRFFPFLIWLKGYEISFLRNDLIAGLTVAVVLIPQAMAYAMLAGMPPVYGQFAPACHRSHRHYEPAGTYIADTVCGTG